jgi:hypothetical protein
MREKCLRVKGEVGVNFGVVVVNVGFGGKEMHLDRGRVELWWVVNL